MAKVAKQTAPAGADATKASPQSDSAKGRAQRVMEIAAEASEELDKLETRISLRPGPQKTSEQSARSGRQVSDNRVWVRIMDTVMGWSFVVGLFVWTYVLRLFGPKRS